MPHPLKTELSMTNAPGAFAMIASQRSGTQLLREILNSNPHVAIIAEPYSPNAHPATWHKFIQTRPNDQVPSLAYGDTAALLDKYIQSVQHYVYDNNDRFGGPKKSQLLIGLDIKYNQIKCCGPLFSDLRSRPFLLEYFSNRSIPILHLVRRNLVHVAISIIVANMRKVWHNHDGSSIPGQYYIPLDELFAYINWVGQERDEFVRLSGDLQVITCNYEDVVDDICHTDKDGNISKDSRVLSCLASFLDVPNRFNYNAYIQRVINRPYSEILENYSDVRKAVKDSEFAEFADTI